ncbi:23S ribosomal RNA methyltransferase Erm [Brachybacterium sp. YJGR34]|uniref:23S ribosomal RNA methyltransferase Erm n=1 Tax=Brachybacterium sp. YJGR34 TaxID=2059911 RepID=UPI000E0B6893|nr:23S ribosomal RNA methyltransferase Erm [Brachybacterium sp. YJGR34]
MSRHHPGPHELGQNHLHDPHVIDRVVALVARTDGPVVEWGAGDGALTLPLAALGRPLEAVEIDERAVRRLTRRLPGRTGARVTVTHGDLLAHVPPSESTLVANLPFHLTTPALRHLLRTGGWTDAVLITQWEVARKRAGVGGSTLMTAQWWPWYEVRLETRIPAAAFRPRPGVDSGLLRIHRRAAPLVADADRRAYQDLVRRIFTGRGRGLEQILRRSGGLSAERARSFCREHGYRPQALPRDVDPAHWAEALVRARGRRGAPVP